ncbi:MAG: DUF881 domain-containing protein [Candidatus Nanopelagicales bacterium]
MQEPRSKAPTAATPPVEHEADQADYHASSLWHWSGVSSLIGGGLFALLGLLLVAGALAYNSQDILENARPAELVQILDSLEAENDRLDEEKRRLDNELESLQSGTSAEALDQARERLADLEVLAGTTAVRGPGVRLVIRDPDGVLDAADVIDAVQELRDAGAESIEVADRRVVVNTWFGDVPDDQKPGILVSGDVRRSPYVILAIGDPQTLATAMEIPGGVADRIRTDGAEFSSDRRDSLDITSTVPLSAPEYAQPVQTG